MAHRQVRERRKDILHPITHGLTAKADVVRAESLNVGGMRRKRRLAMSVADAGMPRFGTFLVCKADGRGRAAEKIDPWFPSSQACSCCGTIKPAMRDLKRRVFVRADGGHVEGRDRNAARNVHGHRQECSVRSKMNRTTGRKRTAGPEA